MAEVIQGVFPTGDATPDCASVAALNLSPEPGDTEGNLLLAGRALMEAARENPSLRWVVLPELFTCSYSALCSVHRYAEDAERGESARFFRALARELGLYIAYGFPEAPAAGPVAGRAVFDSANLVGPEGVLATYRKRNLVKTTGEDLAFTPGESLPVVEAGGLRARSLSAGTLAFRRWQGRRRWTGRP